MPTNTWAEETNPLLEGKIDSKSVKAYVDERMNLLHSLKQHRYLKFWEIRAKYKMLNQPTMTEGGYTDYSMNTQFAIVATKASEVLQNTPKYDFIALDEDGRRYKRLRELFWDYVWMTSRTDKAIFEIVMDSLKYGIGFGKESYVCEKRMVKMPKVTKDTYGDDKIKFEEKEIIDYEGCRLNYLSWQNVWVNGKDMEQCTEAIILTYYDRAKFFQVFGNNPMYKKFTEKDIPVGKYYYVGENSNGLTIDWSSTSTATGQNWVESSNIVSVLEFYNKYKDEYIVLANGEWMNPFERNIMPNPNPSKEIPIVAYTDIYLEDDIYSLGEFDITDKSCALKNETRSLSIEVVKAQGGIITIDPDSEFDESIMQLGIRKYARVEKDAFWFFAPNINASTLQYVESKADEDIIIESGIDFRSQLLSQGETATKTQGRIQASLKRISLGVKYNAYTFYERLARLRLANMEFYKEKETIIQTKNIDISPEGNVKYMNGGYGLFTMKPEYLGGKIALIPSIDSMVGNTTQEDKQKYLEIFQLLLSLIDPETGKPLYNPAKLIEAGRGIIDDVIDLDKLSEKTPITQSADSMLDEMDKDSGMPPTMEQMMNQGIPPEQQSGRATLLPSSPNTQWA